MKKVPGGQDISTGFPLSHWMNLAQSVGQGKSAENISNITKPVNSYSVELQLLCINSFFLLLFYTYMVSFTSSRTRSLKSTISHQGGQECDEGKEDPHASTIGGI